MWEPDSGSAEIDQLSTAAEIMCHKAIGRNIAGNHLLCEQTQTVSTNVDQGRVRSESLHCVHTRIMRRKQVVNFGARPASFNSRLYERSMFICDNIFN